MILSKQQRRELDAYVSVTPALDPYLEGEMIKALDTIDSLELLASRLIQMLLAMGLQENVIHETVINHFAPHDYNPYEDRGYDDGNL